MRDESTRATPTRRPTARHTLAGALAALTLGAALFLLPSFPADAESDSQKIDNPAEWKDEFKARYLALRVEEARLEKTIELATKEYADANRRQYRRSGVRHFHHVNAEAARVRLEEVKAEKKNLVEEMEDFGGFAWWVDEFEETPLNERGIEGLGA